jgi:hypothetical protein
LATEYRGWKDIQEDFNEIIDENTPTIMYAIDDSELEGINAAEIKPSVDKGKSKWTVFLGTSSHLTKREKGSIIVHENFHVTQRNSGRRYSQTEELDAYRIQGVYSPYYVKQFIRQSGSSGLMDAVRKAYPLIREY